MSGSSIVPTYGAHRFYHASDLPEQVWRALRQHEAPANVVLPFAEKAFSMPRGDDGAGNLWIAIYDGMDAVALVLSCTTGPLGDYPIFIVACKTMVHLSCAMIPLVVCLLGEVPPQRVFSVFAPARVSATFAEVFVAQVHAKYGADVGIQAIQEPYYDATITYCTRETLRKPSEAFGTFPGYEGNDVVIALRRANMSDLRPVAAMCKAFSETSPPFVLNDAGAEIEAQTMIANGQVWVHIVQSGDSRPAEVACLVATTRESENVTAVTKVFTNPRWRGHGCAGRLLHRVCQEILEKKARVVLYVGNSAALESARKVYHKVGFQGLNLPQGQYVKDVERWVETGFTGTTLGYW